MSGVRVLAAVAVVVTVIAAGWFVQVTRERGAHAAPVQSQPLTLNWASTNYGIHEPGGAVVELLVVVGNASDASTESTSIRWDPQFASAYAFLASDPPPWRVRIDEAGHGVLDTSGVLPHEDGTFRLLFTYPDRGRQTPDDPVPLVQVISNGAIVVGTGIATPLHAAERSGSTLQQTFERGVSAAVVDRLGFIPVSPDGVFRFGVAFALLLTLISGVGGAVAFCVAPGASQNHSA